MHLESNKRSAGAWRVGEHQSHFDPLLECVVAIARIFDIPTTSQALSAGLPLESNRVTPALMPRVAALTAKIARRSLSDLRPGLLPAILLLQDNQACVLLEWLPNGDALVRYPEKVESPPPR